MGRDDGGQQVDHVRIRRDALRDRGRVGDVAGHRLDRDRTTIDRRRVVDIRQRDFLDRLTAQRSLRGLSSGEGPIVRV